ncbi:hypothetical protein F383_13657 [Gossypium arboreum]|uniref:Uncharacterized protein n=1 Tax=Gossypium arboreum TaxID=29729 RepID=A0A0B0PM85_GOSAR|nr:hypothetical protein F383_13657 [Gossypium arboreum]
MAWSCLAQPSTRPGTQACGCLCDPSQYVPPVFTRLVTRACLMAV